MTTDSLGRGTPGGAAWTFIHTHDLPLKGRRIQRAVLTKTAQKYSLSGSMLSAAVSPAAAGLSSQLITNSIVQNEVLFSSDGLTLLSLDRIYSIKSALAAYAKSKSPLRLEDAVDELRRYVLANSGAKVTKSDLLRSYDWLNVGTGAVSDLDRMYRRAYGGPDQVGAISGLQPTSRTPALTLRFCPDPDPVVRRSSDGLTWGLEHHGEPRTPQMGLVATTSETNKPLLKIQTTFEVKPKLLSARRKGGREQGQTPEKANDDIPREQSVTTPERHGEAGQVEPWQSRHASILAR
ncbi:hypothetical protein UVI_02038500 [Ustilaginoidea virens]|uniref:DUF7582 domain-containing protein n=1 Tax=Ustilaginoidea virens TaxID=1159556 RepID=A0A1B5KT72_USTVR|nr:hypothetical protein UVI_02038500 [Ustilaginoidea virens]